MTKIAQRLDRLERATERSGVAVCRMCYGYPFAAIHVMYASDPNGPGLRRTGECYLVENDVERTTDDLRCRQCGAPAVQMHLMTSAEGPFKPTGRRVCIG